MLPNREIPIIGIYSPYAGAGKSTVANRLNTRFGFARLKMAGPLKDMLRQYLASQGVPLTTIEEMIEGKLKNEPSDLLAGKSARYAMQTIGTEWGRDCMGIDFWCNAAKTQILKATENGLSVVVDDVRFPNEAQMIRDIGGYMVRVRRPDMEVAVTAPWYKTILSKGHRSEGGLDKWSFDLEITNRYTDASEFAVNAANEIINLVHSGKSERAPPFIGR